MKKLFAVSLLLALAIVVVAAGPAYGAGGLLNGKENASVGGVGTNAITLQIVNENGIAVTAIKRTDPNVSHAIRGYWVAFGGWGDWSDATVTINISVVGLPQQTITYQLHQDPAGASWTELPFAVTEWGGTGTGKGRVTVVLSNAGVTSLRTKEFDINPS